VSGSRPTWLIAAILALLCGLSACGGHARQARSASTAATLSSSTPVLESTDLDTRFSSPTGRYTIRVNHSWKVQQLPSQAGIVDLFSLERANFSVVSANVIPGTKLDQFVQSEMDQYRQVKIQGLERVGTVDVGGGQGTAIRAKTYVDSRNITVYTPPSPNAKARTLYQAFYLSGDVSYTFSMVWDEGDRTDYLGLFRSILRTFTLAGAT
jgi:hypothetical protein